MAISGKIKIWPGEQCDYCGRAAHNCQSWAINWLAHWSLQEGIENRCLKTEDRTRTRRSWHNILEACSGCQHFMLVVSESQLAVAATATAAESSLRTVRVFPLQKKKVLERRSQNNRAHPTPWRGPLCVRRKQRQLLTTHYDTKLETKLNEVCGNLLRGPGDRHFIAHRTGPAWFIALFYPFLISLVFSLSRARLLLMHWICVNQIQFYCSIFLYSAAIPNWIARSGKFNICQCRLSSLFISIFQHSNVN